MDEDEDLYLYGEIPDPSDGPCVRCCRSAESCELRRCCDECQHPDHRAFIADPSRAWLHGVHLDPALLTPVQRAAF